MTESAPAALPAPDTIRARVIVFWVPLLWLSIPLVPACIFLLRFGCPRSALALGCYIGLGGAYLFTMFWLLVRQWQLALKISVTDGGLRHGSQLLLWKELTGVDEVCSFGCLGPWTWHLSFPARKVVTNCTIHAPAAQVLALIARAKEILRQRAASTLDRGGMLVFTPLAPRWYGYFLLGGWLLLISAIAIGLGWMLMVDVSILQRVPMMLKVHIIMFLFAVATAVAPIWSIAGKATRYVRISRNGIDVGDNDAGLLAWPMIREVRQRGRFIMQFMLYDNRSIRVSSSVSNGWLLGELLQQHFPDFQPFAPSMPAAAVTGKPIERTSRPDQG